uniref:Venom S1 protease with CUB domain 4 n=1 Tax=Oncocephalus sp. TaxID=2944721 RepID=A0AB38ZEL2_9HEMI
MNKVIFLVVAIALATISAEDDNIIKLPQGFIYTDLNNPEYPGVYNSNKPVIWKFESEPNTKIQIKCDDFRMSKTEDCQAIKLEVDTGDAEQAYCGDYDALRITSSSNTLTVKLQGNGNAHATFSCYVKSTQLPQAKEVEVKLNEIFNFGTPREPAPFFDKVWHLTAEKPYQVSLKCYINLLEMRPCHGDVLTIDLGTGPIEYCGYVEKLLYSRGKDATVRIELDKEGDGKVFCIAQAAKERRKPGEKQVDEIQDEKELKDLDLTNIKQGVEARNLDDDSSEHGVKLGNRGTTCSCGWANKPKARIFYGSETADNEYPWMVGLRAHFGNVFYRCGGSLITHRHVLTASHCLVDLDGGMMPVDPWNLYIVVGARDVDLFMPRKTYREYQAEQRFIRPEFITQMTHDIGLVISKDHIPFSDFVGPICLSPDSLYEANKRITIMGWGKTELGPASSRLLKAKTNLIDRRHCRVNKWEVCTRTEESATCTGDSGGPLVWVDPETNRYTQVSLVSYGHPDCVSSPTVSTEVAYFYDWIQAIIQATYPEERTCNKV